MPSTTGVPTRLLAELRNLHHRDPSLLDNDLPDLRLWILAGGRHNQVFVWDSPDGETCIKLYRTDKHDRASHEYQALTHIATCGITAAPRPLWHDPDPDLSAVAMTMVPGKPVPDLAKPTTALPSMVAVLGRLREIPLGPFAQMPRVDSATNYLKRITEVWPAQLDVQDNEPLTADMRSLLNAWHERGDAAILAQPAPRIFSRGDAHLLNWLWDGSQARVVDWEFAGYSDTAYDAAELVEHLSSHAIDDTWWLSLLPDLGITGDTTRRRFLAAQHTVALHLLSVLWRRRYTRVDEFEFQLKRVRELMRSDFI